MLLELELIGKNEIEINSIENKLKWLLPNDLIFLSASFKGFRKKSDLIKNEMIKLKEKKEQMNSLS